VIKLTTALTAALMAGAFATTGAHASGFDQAALVKPIAKKLTFIFVPKVVHPWYDVVQAGVRAAIKEEKAEGIDISYTWDAPPQADVDDQNRRIETDIGRNPDGLAVSCLDPSTNTQLLKEAVSRGVKLLTFDTYCSPDFPGIMYQPPPLVRSNLEMHRLPS
jgi:ribose transport system substrate-binding protein